jgi:very-short-patch-repair endonuclease
MTDAEQILWYHLRRKQILETQFYRQKAIGDFIVDFFAPRARWVVEVDGGQHWEEGHQEKGFRRDEALRHHGLEVLRFSNLEVLQDLDPVLVRIWNEVERALSAGQALSTGENPP